MGYFYCVPKHTRKNIIKLNTADDSIEVLNAKGTNPNIGIQMSETVMADTTIYCFLNKDFDEIIKIDTKSGIWEYMDEDSKLANALSSIDETNPIGEIISSDGYIVCIPKKGQNNTKISTKTYKIVKT